MPTVSTTANASKAAASPNPAVSDLEKYPANSLAAPTGKLPLGYVRKRDGSRVQPALHPDDAGLINEAFRLAAVRKSSLQSILGYVNKRGLRTRRGGTISKATLHRILTNRYYAGLVRRNSEWVRGEHPALISGYLFAKVQKSLRSRRK